MSPDRQTGADEARRQFRDLIDEVMAEGAHITVERYGKPVAVIVPVSWYEEVRSKTGIKEGQ